MEEQTDLKNNRSSLSMRGLKASTTVLRPDFEIFFEAVTNLYDKETNPDGTFPMNIAENKLNWKTLKEKIERITAENKIPDWVSGYTSALGHPEVRQAVSRFFPKHLTKCPIDPDRLGLSAGATAVIEMTSLLLGDQNDVAVFPAPCYPVYKQDIGNKSGIERYDLVTHHELSEIKDGLVLTIAQLENALEDIESQGKRFRMLVLTTPDNPTGGIYTQEQLEQIASWCIDHRIHLIVNEIYGLSLIDIHHPELEEDYSNSKQFVSFAPFIEDKKSEYLHYWYSFSKDFGISGLRVGVIYSHNEEFMKAYQNYNAPHMVSNHTQWILQMILDDEGFIENYIKSNQVLLTESYLEMVRPLRMLNIPYVPSKGSLFIWIDLSEFLEENTEESEWAFWLEIYHETGILFTPGNGFGHSKKGLFRVVYSVMSKEDLVVAMERFYRYIISKRGTV